MVACWKKVRILLAKIYGHANSSHIQVPRYVGIDSGFECVNNAKELLYLFWRYWR